MWIRKCIFKISEHFDCYVTVGFFFLFLVKNNVSYIKKLILKIHIFTSVCDLIGNSNVKKIVYEFL